MPAGIPKVAMAVINGWLRDRILHISDAGAPVDGTSGTGAGKCGPGSIYTDKTNGFMYVNIGTEASPSWGPIENTVRVPITNAEFLAIRATPKQIIAAPGAGKFLRLHQGIIIFDRTGAYTETADNLAMRYENTTGIIATQSIETTGFVDAAGDAINTIEPKVDVLGLASNLANKALVLHNTGDGEFGGGNAANVITVIATFSVWPTGL